MLRLLLEAIKEWVEELLNLYAKKDDIIVYCPDDKGAVGDGITIDDDAFLEGNYAYQLTKGKVYRVSLNKLKAIYGNDCIGEGVIRMYTDAYYNTHKYGDNKEIIPTYGNGTHIVEMSARSRKNRLLECINHVSIARSNNTEDMGRYYRTQAVSVLDSYAHKYHGIGAVQRDRDKADTLPDTFTICLGRMKVLTRKKGDSVWIKTIDELINPAANVRNYGIPWTATVGYDVARSFTNPPVIVDNHVEIKVTKEEFNSWLGDAPEPTEGNLHFWTNDYSAESNEFYDMIVAQEVWVKEAAASNKLLYTLGCDCYRGKDTSTGKYDYFSQIIIDVQKYLTNEPQMFYGCTMDEDGALAVNFDEITSIVADDKKTVKSTLANYNLLSFSEDFTITQGAYIISYDKLNDVFTFAMDENTTPSWQSIDLTPYLTEIPNIKEGEKYRFYIEPLEGQYKYQCTFYYSSKSGSSIAISTGYETTDGVISKSLVASTDFTALAIGTNATSVSYPKFRIWFTKGESYKGYQPYGKNIDALYQPFNVINPIIEERLTDIEQKINEFKSVNDKLVDFETRIKALEDVNNTPL